MLLSKLELHGFKSFPNRTELSFDNGIMAIVGPNGCGKTNILDSIRWVLGEQRSSLLRGSKMEEVIFNGSGQQRPADMAEVSLTIKNNRGVLPLEYDELVVSRRLYRSGESEYLINKTACRLRDIVDLFADTGMGAHAYSLFQPSMIDSVLSDNAEERRFMFEEAAGITRYKNRKKETLKKLENTEADLIRLSDIINEISKNVRSLRRQASKAKRYKNIKEELRNLEIKRASAKLFDLEQKIKACSDRINVFRTDQQAIKTDIDKEEATIEHLKLETTRLSDEISDKASKTAELSEQGIRFENEITSIQTRLSSGRENVNLWNREIENLKQRIKSLETQQSQIEKQHNEKSTGLKSLDQETIRAESRVIFLREKLDKFEASLESLKESRHKLENEITADTIKHDSILNSLERLTNLKRSMDKSIWDYRVKKEKLQEELRLHRAKIEECKADVIRIDRRLGENNQEQIGLLSQIDDIKKKISLCNAEKSAVEAKIDLLSQMVIHYEGYGSGIKDLFAWADKPEGLVDTLTNLLKVDKQYHLAVESALNKYGQLVVCHTRDDVYRCIDYLKSNSLGRVGFLILDNVDHANVSVKPIKAEGYISNVAELIDCLDYLKPVMERIFANISVFESGKIPDDYSSEAVDLDGNYYNPFGIIAGGKSDITLIGKMDELSGLKDLLGSLKKKQDYLERSLQQSQSSLTEHRKGKLVLDEQKKTLLFKRENLFRELTKLEFEFQECVNRLEQLSSDSADTDKQLKNFECQKDEIKSRITDSESRLQKLNQQISQLSDDQKKHVNDYENASSELSKLRLKSVEISGLLQKLGEDMKRISELIDEATKMVDYKSEMIDTEHSKWHELESRKDEIKSKLIEVSRAKDTVEDNKIDLNNKRGALAQQRDESEGVLKSLRKKSSEINEKIHQEELKLADLKNSLKTVEEGIFSEYGVWATGAKDKEYDESLINSEIERLKNIIEKVGPINMLADEEYNNEKDRLDFLESQYADLKEAKSSLNAAIRKINQTAREKFSDTFELIKENFQKVFETLFEGGTAEVRLADPDDLLNSPIEITARPKGKKLVSLNQLSGGERALTAISLLFAIYMVKPSPFCILDEIDAPLDDANIGRFIKLIRKFTQSTQFIVITHNKRTMEAAGILYGVTMETPGISRIVSVKFNGDGGE